MLNIENDDTVPLKYFWKKSYYFFEWYQQLIAESLGKKGKGILPVISEMPKDNHSLMQFLWTYSLIFQHALRRLQS